eukprot:TRINITY_DN408_c0_g1_i1.p1 TRINITY_DN408_c0_g1~~TRINITY_DN408_c0_g1_i1.p1  ORF type:complete len:476 (-),score=30.93 TRINITY_DN408_c0_g1_i1:389-1816(-)
MSRLPPIFVVNSFSSPSKVLRKSRVSNLVIRNEHTRPEVRVRRLPGTWNDLAVQKAEFDEIHKKLKLQSYEEWYSVKRNQVTELGGGGILKRHKTLQQALEAIYPEHKWEKWRFKKRSLAARFDDEKALRTELERIGTAVGIKSMEDWYLIEYRQFVHHGAKAILRMYEDSPYKLLSKVYPEHEWLPWRFKVAPHGFWPDIKNQRVFMEYLLKNIKGWKIPEELDKVYSLKRSEIRDAGGRTLLTYYDHTVSRMFAALFPDHQWEEWKFYWASSLTFWNRQAQQRNYTNARAVLESLAKIPEMGISAPEDWYRVGREVLGRYGALGMVKAFGGLAELLMKAYPEHSWDLQMFNRSSKASSEHHLGSILRSLFPNATIQSRSRVSRGSDTSISSELDFYLPEYRLAFEYQGAQHYEDLYAIGQSRAQQETDTSKQALCATLGITLIEFPHTEAVSAAEVRRMVLSRRPDLEKRIEK